MTSTDTTDRALGGAREARDNARARLMHYARVDAAVALQREGILADDSPEGLTEALDTLGIRPPCRYIDALRARFPRIYGIVEGAPDTGDALDPLRQLHNRALEDYATELLTTANLIAALEVDPIGTYEREHDTEGLAIPVAEAAADLLDQARDEYDALIGASYATTHNPG